MQQPFNGKKPTLPGFKSNLNYLLRGTYDIECQLNDACMFSVVKSWSAAYGRLT